jgi:hypothetical protein
MILPGTPSDRGETLQGQGDQLIGDIELSLPAPVFDDSFEVFVIIPEVVMHTAPQEGVGEPTLAVRGEDHQPKPSSVRLLMRFRRTNEAICMGWREVVDLESALVELV